MGMHTGMGLGRIVRQDDIAEKPKITKELLLRILKYFSPYWKQQLVVIISVALIAALGLIPPLLIQGIIDMAIPQGNMRQLIILTTASLGSSIILGLFQVIESYLNTWIAKHVVFDLRNQMYTTLQKMGLRFYTDTRTGDIISRINNDVSGIENVISGTIVGTLSSIMTVLFTLIAIFGMNWRLAILGICLLPTFILPTLKVGKARWRLAKRTQEKLSELNQVIQETLGVAGAVLVKIFTKEEDEEKKFVSISKDVIKLQLREAVVGRWFFMFVGVFSSIGPVLIYFYGGYLVIKGDLSVGIIVAFIALLNRLYRPVAQLFNIHIDIIRSLALFERIFQYLDLQPDIQDKSSAIVLPEINGKIEFYNVYFSYKKGIPTLKNISFTAEPGQLIALVGPSGAGKSTITHLVPRLYDADEGIIRIDGVDIKDISVYSLRSQIGVVTQDTFLFNCSIMDNILYGRSGATEDEVIEACKSAYIHDFIISLPQGYDTIVGERGVKLSGGEKQRIAIARAILKNPRIIILDEATSSLDSNAETLIKAALEPLLKNRTSLVIAHRLSTILAADKILVIEDGEIVESGNHDELLKNSGLYYQLYEKQFHPQNTHI